MFTKKKKVFVQEYSQFIGALFIAAPNQNNPDVYQQMDKLWYIHTREYCSMIKRKNEPLICVTT